MFQNLCADQYFRYGGLVRLHEKTSHYVAESAKFLQASLDQGDIIYGELRAHALCEYIADIKLTHFGKA